jgi:PTH1 family peptidyl-tRNA hydrolase
MKLIVGLGNPGKDYSTHRHNVGWMVLDRLIGDDDKDVHVEEKFGGLVARSVHFNDIFFKPLTFMNSSGDAVATIAGFYKIEAKDIIVVHDEMDIPLGDVRVKTGGGHAGHNGVKSVINRLGTKDFTRVRCGIGRPDEGVEVLQHVLGSFKQSDAETLSGMLARAAADIHNLLATSTSEEA